MEYHAVMCRYDTGKYWVKDTRFNTVHRGWPDNRAREFIVSHPSYVVLVPRMEAAPVPAPAPAPVVREEEEAPLASSPLPEAVPITPADLAADPPLKRPIGRGRPRKV